MSNRMAIVLAIILGLATQATAQVPEDMPTEPANIVPVSQSEEIVPAQAMPAGTIVEGPVIFPAGNGLLYGPGERIYSSMDYMLGWIHSQPVPALVTTSPAGTSQAAAGVLGANNTSILFGQKHIGGTARSGIRLGVGGWIDDNRTLGVDIGFFMLESRNTLFGASSSGSTILARPYTDATTGLQASQLIAFPGVASGNIAVSARSDNLYSGHFDLQEVIIQDQRFRWIALFGYRVLHFDDNLNVGQKVTSLGGGGVIPGTTLVTADSFSAHNEFNGIDMGFRTEFFWERWTLGILTKVAVGPVHRDVAISGSTVTTVPGFAPINSQGGFLALASNIGRYGSTQWTAVPELGANVGWNLTSWLRLRFGYSALFFTNTARATDQVSTVINPNLFPPAVAGATPNSPSFHLVRSDLWVQNVTFGVEFRY